MKKATFLWWFIVAAAIMLGGCSENSPSGPGEGGKQASEQRHFVWNAMNFWYYWQADVPQLADNHRYFKGDQAFESYLRGFANPDSLFQSLLYKKDRFSYFIPNYKTFNNQSEGKFTGPGFAYGYVRIANSPRIFGYVQYIVPDSPADKAGLKRGDIFMKVDGTALSLQNYQGALSGQSSYTLTLGKIKGNSIASTDSTITIQTAHFTKDPVFHHTVIDTDGTKIGYLVYNAFHTNRYKELNNVFGTFKAKGISALILDLRYDGGGALMTAQLLGGMISGEDSLNEFAKLKFNDKRSAQDTTVGFLNDVPVINDQGKEINTIPMNSLSINQVYILIGRGTASASEALISGLKPYMNVTLVGDTTIGKNHGEYILYDNPPFYIGKKGANPKTKFAIVPMAFKITNKNHLDYSSGFAPDYEVDEISYLNHLPPLGSPKDPLASKAISLILGKSGAVQPQARLLQPHFNGELIKDSRNLRPQGNMMYLLPGMFKKAEK